MTWTNLNREVADIFEELDGTAHLAGAIERWAAFRRGRKQSSEPKQAQRPASKRDQQRARWRRLKKQQRARRKRAGDKRYLGTYAKRYATKPAFRAKRKAYWREYDKKRSGRKRGTKGQS